MSGKRLELFKEAVPVISRVAVLIGGSNVRANLEAYATTARRLNITLRSLELIAPKPELEGAFDIAVKAGVNAVITNRDALTASYPKRIAELAIKHRLPTMNEDSPYVEAGGLMSYAASDLNGLCEQHGMSIRFSKEPSPLIFPSSNRQSSSS